MSFRVPEYRLKKSLQFKNTYILVLYDAKWTFIVISINLCTQIIMFNKIINLV